MSNYYVTDKYYGNSAPKVGEDPVFGIRTIGASKWVDQQNPDVIKAIQGEIWAGAGHIEVTAPGTGRGGRGNSTFEEFDDEQRQAIRELVKINKVNLSVHATPNVQMSGFDNRSGFQDEIRQRSIEEVKKAIDFSRDASSGGSVVVHTGEFSRPLDVPGRYEGQFRFHDEERDKAQYLLADKETGQLIQSVRANEKIVLPIYETDDKGKLKYLKDEKGQYVYDDVLKEFLLQKHKTDDWSKIPDAAKEDARVKLTKTDADGNIKTRYVSFQEFMDDELKKGKKTNEVLLDFYKEQMYGNVQHSLGQARQYENNYRDSLRERELITKELNFYRNLKEKVSADEWERLSTEYAIKHPGKAELNQSVTLDPIKAMEEKLGDNQKGILYGQEIALGGRKQAKELLRKIENAQNIEEYALDKSKKSFAEVGIYAMEQTMAAQKMRPGDKVKPIFVSLENIYPEMGYGSHPEELLQLVKNARGEMAKELMSKMQFDKKRADKAAEDHIKVTFDTGHMNMWRKHFIPKDGETKEKTDARFKDWYLEEVEKLAKAKVIGNVHLADNFGYDDAHLAPGHGNTPIKDVLDILKKHGYDQKMAVEGGFNQNKNGYHETWKMVGAHIDTKYARGRDGTDAWLNPNSNFRYVRDGYLGVANRPNFIFKGYSPDSDDWKPWSGLGME